MARREEYGRSWQELERGRFGTRGGQDDDEEWQTRGYGGRQGGRQTSWQDDDEDDRFGTTRPEGREGWGSRGPRYEGSRGSRYEGSRGSRYEGSRGLSRWEEEDDYNRGRTGTQGGRFDSDDRSGEMGPSRGRMSHGGGRPMDYAEDWGLHDWPRGRVRPGTAPPGSPRRHRRRALRRHATGALRALRRAWWLGRVELAGRRRRSPWSTRLPRHGSRGLARPLVQVPPGLERRRDGRRAAPGGRSRQVGLRAVGRLVLARKPVRVFGAAPAALPQQARKARTNTRSAVDSAASGARASATVRARW
jgi:hypothetical protein